MRAAALCVLVLLAAGCGSEAARPDRTTTLLAAGDGELWLIDGATGRTRHVERPELPGGDPPHRVVRRGNRFVLWPVGSADFFLPSAHPDRIWQVETGRAVREVELDGTVTVPDARPPGWPEVATLAGLAIHTRHRTVIWDPRRERIVRRFRPLGDLGGTWRNLLTSCRYPCRNLRVTHAGTGAHRTVQAPPGVAFEAHAASFSPAGDRIAVPARKGSVTLLALVDRDRVTLISGSHVPEGYRFVTWSASGREVFITGGMWDRVIKRYRLGDARATRLRARVGRFYGIAAR